MNQSLGIGGLPKAKIDGAPPPSQDDGSVNGGIGACSSTRPNLLRMVFQ